ncbi:hypothetical protein, partial [Nocardioides sp.]|uniref:hypothetical protein n=1 Tax=Nocardioides sp. TaxID=35761 RepID=UPI0025D1A44D
VRFREPTTATDRTATCRYPRGSNDEGYGATVVVTSPDGQKWHATRAVQVSDPPGTVEGSSAFAADSPEVEVQVAADGSLTSDTVRSGARIVLAAAAGTFRPGSMVRIHQGNEAELQAELGSGAQVQGGFAVVWVDATGRKYDLAQPLVVTITPDAGAQRRQPKRAFDFGR